jgi:hypothetical protein
VAGLALIAAPADAHQPAPNAHSIQMECSSWPGQSSFIFGTPIELLAHPQTNETVVGGDNHRYGNEWIYYLSRVAWVNAAGQWNYAWGDWIAIRNGTSGAYGPIGAWYRFNSQAGRWEAPTGYNGSAMEPRSGVLVGYSPGATAWVGGWIWWGPVEGHPTFHGQWHWVDWTKVTC